MTLIKKKQGYFTHDYKNEPLPALFYKQPSDCDFSYFTALEYIDIQDVISDICVSRQTILLACDKLNNKSLITALQERADSGVRVYLLLGNRHSNQNAIDCLSGRCLIRTGISQQGALVLVDHMTTQTKGRLLMSARPLSNVEADDIKGDLRVFARTLDAQQVDDSFRGFCKLFWEDTDRDEYLKQNQASVKVAHPDGHIVTNHSHQLCGTLKDCLRDSLHSLHGASQVTFDRGGAQLLLKTNAPDISSVARKKVALTDSHIPSILISRDGNWILPDTPDFNAVNWCLKLSDRHSNTLKENYERAIKEAAWQYQCDIRIGHFPPKQALRFADQPGLIRLIESKRHLSLDDIKTDDIDSFLTRSPHILAKPQTAWQRDLLAHEIDYQVTIHPPYCPEDATQDLLYNQWEKSEILWQSCLNALQNQQEKINDQQAGIADRLKLFMKGFLLGQGQSVKQLNREMEELKLWSVTEATPAEREEMNKRLQTLQQNISYRKNDTEEKLDEAKLRQIWEEKRNALDKVRERQADIVRSKSSIFQDIEKKKAGKQEQAEYTFQSQWQKEATALTDDEVGYAKNKTRELLFNMGLREAKNWRNGLKDKEWKKHYSMFERVFENHRLALQKIERDIKEAKTEWQKSQLQLTQAQHDLDHHGANFIYQPNKKGNALDDQLGLNEVKANLLSSFSWPKEELPTKGTVLFCNKNNRFLVVAYMHQLDEARKDANRLKAKIVCEKEKVNA